MRWSCLQFNVLLLPESYRRLSVFWNKGEAAIPPPLQQGMWYDLEHKQQKMPKARANIYVYSSTLFSGWIFEDEMIRSVLRERRAYLGRPQGQKVTFGNSC